MADRFTRIMTAQYAKALRDFKEPNLLFVMDERKISDWYFLACNLPAPFEFGELMFKLSAPDDFPQNPPSFSFITKNGVFEPGGKICTSIGEFHKNDSNRGGQSYGWRQALGMVGFAREMVNALISYESLGGGIRIVHDRDPAVIQRLARASADFNLRDHTARKWMPAFEQFCHDYPDQPAVQGLLQWRAVREVCDADDPSQNQLERAFAADWSRVSAVATRLTANRRLRDITRAVLLGRTPSRRSAAASLLKVGTMADTGDYVAFYNEFPNAYSDFCAAWDVTRFRNALTVVAGFEAAPDALARHLALLVNFSVCEDLDCRDSLEAEICELRIVSETHATETTGQEHDAYAAVFDVLQYMCFELYA